VEVAGLIMAVAQGMKLVSRGMGHGAEGGGDGRRYRSGPATRTDCVSDVGL
jgi:hypothetical protein